MELCGLSFWGQWVKEEMQVESNTDVDKLESFQGMSWGPKFSIIPEVCHSSYLEVGKMVLWAWQPMRPAFQVAGFQTQSIHLLPTVVAIRWQLSPQAKWKEEWLWVPTLAGTCKKRVFFFFLTLPISLFPGKLGRIFWGCGVHTMSLLPEGVSSAKVSLSMLRRLMTVESPCCNYMTGLNKPTIRVPLPGIYDLVINTVKRKVWNAQINTLLQNYRFLLYFRFL